MKIDVHPQARSWIDQALMSRVTDELGQDDVIVHIWPRSMEYQVPVNAPKGQHGWRAVTKGNETWLLVDPTETPQSTSWLLAHELGHHYVDDFPKLEEVLNRAAPTDIPRSGDRFHEVSPEERLADGLATRIVGQRLDREWWRRRVQSMVGGRVSGRASGRKKRTGRSRA